MGILVGKNGGPWGFVGFSEDGLSVRSGSLISWPKIRAGLGQCFLPSWIQAAVGWEACCHGEVKLPMPHTAKRQQAGLSLSLCVFLFLQVTSRRVSFSLISLSH